MPIRTSFVLPLAAGLLTCLSIGLSLCLSAKTSAYQSLSAPTSALHADGLLPLSRLPASATDSQRQESWWFEIATREYIQATVACGLWGKPNRTLHLAVGHMPPLRYGDLVYSHDVIVQPQKTLPNRVSKPIYNHTTTYTSVSTTETPMPAVDDGPPRRLRLTFTRTASGLHIKTVFLPASLGTPPSPTSN